MPKQTVTTIVNAGLDVSPGEAKVNGEEVEIRMLHVVDGPDRYDVMMNVETAHALADLLRQDHVVTAKVIPVPGTKGVKP